MPSLRPSAPSGRSISAHKKHANLRTICHTCNSHKHKHIASTQRSLKTPPIRGIPHPSATTKAQPSPPHAPPTAKEIKPSTSPANPSQALLQATLPYYQPSPSLPKETALSRKPIGATTIWSLLPRVLLAIYRAKATHAEPHDIPLRSDTQALSLIANIPLIQRRKKCCSRKEKYSSP